MLRISLQRFAQNDREDTTWRRSQTLNRSRSWRTPRFAGHLKRQRLKNVLQAVIDDDFLLQVWQDGLHCLEIKTAPRHLRGFAILGEQQRKLLRLAFCFVHPSKRVRFRLFLALFCLAASVWNSIV